MDTPRYDTIFAPSTAPGPAGIAVIRVSGPSAGGTLLRLIGRVPNPRVADLASFRANSSGETLDRGLVLWFPAPTSFTGQDVAELHVHGGRATVAGILNELATYPGLRLAEPGEFTRRAFDAGKIDLAASEALADLVAAETAAQRRLALRGMTDGIGARAERWRSLLIGAMAWVEAEIDFSDEGDVQDGLSERARAIADSIRTEIDQALTAGGAAERMRDGAVIVVAGPPNVGKSSFLNRVAKREVAIVSPHAGTTRDLLEVHLDLGGYPATLIDTAGVREASDPVEVEAVRRASARTDAADLVLWFEDAGCADAPPAPARNSPVWTVVNKADLLDSVPDHKAPGRFVVSAARGDGIDTLLAALQAWLEQFFVPSESAPITRARHRGALEEARARLAGAVAASETELLAEELRLSARALGRISGRVDVEDVLGAIFAELCIGK